MLQSDWQAVPLERGMPDREPRSDAVEAMASLRRAGAEIAGSANADLARLGAAIRRYDAARGGVTLDEELGLTPAGGAGPWWRAEARAKRDALLRQVRSTCMAEMDLGAAAAEIIALARRRQAETTPPTTRVAQLVDRALQCGPLPERKRLRAILGNPPPE